MTWHVRLLPASLQELYKVHGKLIVCAFCLNTIDKLARQKTFAKGMRTLELFLVKDIASIMYGYLASSYPYHEAI
jgi:hypothetical protein